MSETQTVTIADFLLARIAEDEAVARSAVDAGRHRYGEAYATEVRFEAGGVGADNGWLVVDPARVLAECKAKRRIIGIEVERYGEKQWATDVTLALALPYADHPDFNLKWRL